MSVVERLRDMVALDSVSNRSNRPMMELLEQQLAGLGGRIQYHVYRDEVEKVNLLFHLGPAGPPALALVAHSDVVPYDAQWTEALRLTEREGRWYGRGSADTKGSLAAMVEALSTLHPATLREPLVLIATADEEIGCRGAKRLAAERLVHPRFAIIGEPTSLVPIRGHKGYCADEVTVLGQEAHSAYPALGRSAILEAAAVLTSIAELAGELQSDTDASFDPPFTTLNVGTIAGGKARNVIAGDCRFPLEWRPLPSQPLDRVHDRLLELIRGKDVRLDKVRRDAGVLTPADARLVRWLEQETGRASDTVAFGTEMPYLTALGAETCVIGPGDIRVAHRTGEFVPTAELHAAVELYRSAIQTFCR